MRPGGPRILSGAVTIGMAALAVGCSEPRAGLSERDGQAPGNRLRWFELPGSSPSRRNDQIVVVQMQFDVLRIELPAGQIHHSEKTWNYVDELRSDPTQIALLRRNGLRIGAASSEAWAALRATFDACQAKVLRATHAVRQGLPLTLELGEVEPDETVFLITADQRTVGSTFSGGQKYLHVDYQLNPDAESTATLRVTPEIHSLTGEKRWRRDGGRLLKVPEYKGKLFHELACTLTLGAGEFLVIGPDTTTATNLTVGRRFLTREHQGQAYETVLCITPQPFRTEAAKR